MDETSEVDTTDPDESPSGRLQELANLVVGIVDPTFVHGRLQRHLHPARMGMAGQLARDGRYGCGSDGVLPLGQRDGNGEAEASRESCLRGSSDGLFTAVYRPRVVSEGSTKGSGV